MACNWLVVTIPSLGHAFSRQKHSEGGVAYLEWEGPAYCTNVLVHHIRSNREFCGSQGWGEGERGGEQEVAMCDNHR